jgi:hypothetical protein
MNLRLSSKNIEIIIEEGIDKSYNTNNITISNDYKNPAPTKNYPSCFF